MTLLFMQNGKNNIYNRSTILKKVVISTAMSIMLAAGTANAGLYSDTEPFSVNGTTTSSNISLSCFNPDYGYLTAIELTVVNNITPQVQIVNFTNSNLSFANALSTSTVSLNGPGNTSVTDTASTGLTNGTAPSFQVTTFSGPTVSQTQIVKVNPADWGQYIGNGSLSFIASFAPFVSSVTAPATLAVAGNGLANGDITIAYAYTPTPIPAAALLLGSGLMSLAGWRRRKA